ncbi:MAG: RidA family protein [Nitrospira sp.]|nr:RidA family protein [Nitrospira sp.]
MSPTREGPPPGFSMPSAKTAKSLATPWENEFGHVQGVNSGSLIFVAGQLSFDDQGTITSPGNIEAQMRQAYANISKVLAQFGVKMDDVLEETIFVTDMMPALTVAPKVRREVYSSEHPSVASTIVQVQRLAFKDALVEIKVTAKAQQASFGEPRRRPGGMGRGPGGMGSGGYPSPY